MRNNVKKASIKFWEGLLYFLIRAITSTSKTSTVPKRLLPFGLPG